MCCCGLDGMFTFVFCVTHSNDQTRQTCTDLNTGVVRERQRFFLALRAWGTRAWPLAPTVTAIRRVISYGYSSRHQLRLAVIYSCGYHHLQLPVTAIVDPVTASVDPVTAIVDPVTDIVDQLRLSLHLCHPAGTGSGLRELL